VQALCIRGAATKARHVRRKRFLQTLFTHIWRFIDAFVYN
jgi:hypothetical protein